MTFVENEIVDLGNGVWIRVAVDNISWCDVGNGVAVIDALEDPKQADVVRGLIQQTTGSDLKWVVATHWDVDHIACNPQWRREGAPVIAHQSCADSAGDWEGRPDIAYSDKAVLQGATDQCIEMEWMGGTHTPWDSVLWMPHAKVLHIADLFGWGLIPCTPTPAKVDRLREVLEKVLLYDAKHVICGHGPVTTISQVKRFLEYFNQMLTDVPPLLKEGLSADEIEKRIPAPADMHDWWRFVDWKHRKNIELIQEYYN